MKMCLYGVSLATGLIRSPLSVSPFSQTVRAANRSLSADWDGFRPLSPSRYMRHAVDDFFLRPRFCDFTKNFNAPPDGHPYLMGVYHPRESDSRPLASDAFPQKIGVSREHDPSQLAGSVQNQRVGRFGMTVFLSSQNVHAASAQPVCNRGLDASVHVERMRHLRRLDRLVSLPHPVGIGLIRPIIGIE